MDTASPEAPPQLEASPRPALGIWPAILLFFLMAVPISFLGLGSTDVVTMEGIVADGARHMDRTHEYSVPRLHGEIYSYKPPLAYWLALASFRLFGEETEWSLRFPFAASGLLMGLAVLLLTSRVAGPGTGLLCGFASLTGALTIQKFHLAEFDLALAAGVGIAAAVACRIFAGDQPRTALWLLGYLALALGFLAKGAPALMFFAPGLVLASLWTRRFKALWRLPHLAGLALFVLVICAWLASAYQAEGGTVFEQPLSEARDKGLTWSLSTIGSTLLKPLVTAALFLPWTLLLPASFKAGRWSSQPARRMALAAAAFVTAGVAIFMTVPATESRYLLPLAAPVGILCGLAAKDVLAAGGRFRRRAIEGLTILVCLGAVATVVLTESADPASQWLLIALAILTLAVVIRGFFRVVSPARLRRDVWYGVRLVAAIAILAWLTQIRVVGPHRASSRSLQEMAASFEVHLSPEAELWTGPVSKDYHHSSLFFYLRRPVRTFSAQGDGPQAGDYVVFFSDEHQELMSRVPFDYEIIERGKQRSYEFILSKVREVDD